MATPPLSTPDHCADGKTPQTIVLKVQWPERLRSGTSGLLDRKGAAKLLKISTRTLDRLLADDRSKIPVVRIYGCVSFIPKDLLAWAARLSKTGGLK